MLWKQMLLSCFNSHVPPEHHSFTLIMLYQQLPQPLQFYFDDLFEEFQPLHYFSFLFHHIRARYVVRLNSLHCLMKMFLVNLKYSISFEKPGFKNDQCFMTLQGTLSPLAEFESGAFVQAMFEEPCLVQLNLQPHEQ